MDNELFNKVSKEAYEHIDRIITNKANNEILELTNRTLDITGELTARISKIEIQIESFSTMKDIEEVKTWALERLSFAMWKYVGLIAGIIGFMISITALILRTFL